MSCSEKNILFQKFEIIECLKKDTHTAVYLANHIYLGKKIILKSMNTKTLDDSSRIERFKREAKILAKLDHKNIIKVLDFGTFEKFFFISFEYFEGENLRDFINHKKLNDNNRETFITQLFEGLNFAHSFNIIHRDIKPENILVNDKFELKISDFGLALNENDNFITHQNSIVGTPCYMSPEQVQGEMLTIQSDLFSIGLVIYELYKGENPFIGDDVNKTINNIINYNEEDLIEKLNDIPQHISEIIKLLLKKNKDKRAKSISDVSGSLNIDVSNNIKSMSDGKINKNKLLKVYSPLFILITITAYFILIAPDDIIVEKKNTEILSSNFVDPKEDSVLIDLNVELNNSSIVKRKKNNVVSKENLQPNRKEEIIDNENTKLVEQILGIVHINCFPWAEVYIDEKSIGTTPLAELRLEEGTHELILKNPHYPNYSLDVSVVGNRSTLLKYNLDSLFGYLQCEIFPWGDLYIDNEYKGQTPLNKSLILNPGKYKVEIKNPSYKSNFSEIFIRKNDTLRFSFNFEKDNSF